MRSVEELVRCELDDMDVLVFELELPPPPLPELSEGESEVAMLVGEGLSNAAIAHARGVSRRTVASQLRSIFRKLDLGSRWALSLLLTRRAVAAASWANVNPSAEGDAGYEPFGPPTRLRARVPSMPMALLLGPVAAITGGRVANERPVERALRDALAESALASRARSVIRAGVVVGRVPRIDDVAAALEVSARTLQRQLRAERESFRTILTQTRIAEARRRLERGDDPSRVAEALGYASAGSLRRALRVG